MGDPARKSHESKESHGPGNLTPGFFIWYNIENYELLAYEKRSGSEGELSGGEAGFCYLSGAWSHGVLP